MTRPDQPPRHDVFISSTKRDLERYRNKVRDAVIAADWFPHMMEDFAADDRNAMQRCYDAVAKAAVFIGIYAHRYGFAPDASMTYTRADGTVAAGDGMTSITEWEYRWAVEFKIKICLFILADLDEDGQEVPWPPSMVDCDPGKARLQAFKAAVRGKHTVKEFTNVHELALHVMTAIGNLKIQMMATIPAAPAILQNAQRAKATVIPLPLHVLRPYSGASVPFVGRRDELNRLTAWAAAGPAVCAVVAIGGMGKSALAWKWVQDRAVPFDGMFWYSFYAGEADMRECVRHALAYLTRTDPDTLQGGNFAEQVTALVTALNAGRHLLVLDGLERVLVAYHRWDAAQMADDQVPEGADYRDCTDPADADALRALAAVTRSRVLITTRLFPNALTDGGQPLPGADEFPLTGLNPSDARAVWRGLNITWTDADEGALDAFFNHIGRHGLLLKLAAGAINDSPMARGRFRIWYDREDGQFDFASKDVKAKRHHILDAAYRGLSQEGRDLLAQIAVFGTGVGFDTLNVFNPFLPPAPEAPEEPSDVIFERRFTHLDNGADYQRALEAFHQTEAYQTYQKAHSAYLKSPDYKRGLRQFEALLTDLERRGLLWWDDAADLYDLHPVVRGYAHSALDPDEKRAHDARSVGLFEAQEAALGDAVETLADLHIPIALYHALIGAGRLDDAARLYERRLRDPLHKTLALYHTAYALLLPLFADGLDRPPTLTDPDQQAVRLSDMATMLYYLGREQAALTLRGQDVRLRVERRESANLAIALGNYGSSLEDMGWLAAAGDVYRAMRDLAAAAVPDWLWNAHMLLHGHAVALGRWEEADAAYRAFLDAPPRQQADFWRAEVERLYAESLLYRGVPSDAVANAITSAAGYAAAGRSPFHLRSLARLRGQLALTVGDPAAAIPHFERAIEMGAKSGVRDASAWGGLARVYAATGRLRAALRIVGDGCDDYSAAVVLRADGQITAASARALASYTWAWADGEPYVRRYHLDRAGALLDALGVARPVLPPFTEDKARWEHEDLVLGYIAGL